MWDFDVYFKIAIMAVMGLLGWLFKGHENRIETHEARLAATDKTFAERAQRIQAIELTAESKVEADKQRAKLSQDLHEFREEVKEDMASMRSEIGARLETNRVETNDALRLMSSQITALATALAVTVAKPARRRK